MDMEKIETETYIQRETVTVKCEKLMEEDEVAKYRARERLSKKIEE